MQFRVPEASRSGGDGLRVLGLIASAALLIGCAQAGSDGDGASAERFVRLDLGRKGSPEIVRYYMSPFMVKEASGSSRASLLVERNGRPTLVDLDVLAEADSISSQILREQADARARVGWEGFMRFVDQTYNRIRQIPPTLADLQRYVETSPGDSGRIRVDVIGVMSTLRRSVSVRRADVERALRAFVVSERGMVYPTGTTFIADHFDGKRRVETTAMRKRMDGSWDFFAYDSTGALATQTLPRPRSLLVPGQCVGCHFGSKLYEPEKSFPARAGDGPHGPRVIVVDDAVRNVAPVQLFDEHRRRSDHVLGLYGTILTAELLLDRKAGTLEPEAIRLLELLRL